ncbi:MAG: DegT/DnrJ/EryC1/StrS family aminotransferase [Tannerellaceae bacterium]|jgi:dTDP-4-amino-4,6-dideoxygalactose transaminase|nr:DegT/DnrJ/EryC1/StrS family aminotransferase [Tannerellaceae bacterium]
MSEERIQMVDLTGQYRRLRREIDLAMQTVVDGGAFINGRQVGEFAGHMAEYLDAPHVIPCGNGTDALQIALMRLNLRRGDEVIVPAFTYAAAVEAAVLLGLTPVPADVDGAFNLSPAAVKDALSERSKVIMAVHLFGQSCDMGPLMEIAGRNNLFVVEDNAQSLGCAYTFPDGRRRMAGTIGDIGTLSFFPTKILGGYGDGGALVTTDATLAEHIRMTTVHGQSRKYHHSLIGCNSRLDTLQAAILDVKLRYIDTFIAARQKVAALYDEALGCVDGIVLPYRLPASTHVYHQYTILVKEGLRDALRAHLKAHAIPTAIYYPLSVDEQPAFIPYLRMAGELPVSHSITKSVISLPIHTEMTPSQVTHISECVASFFR